MALASFKEQPAQQDTELYDISELIAARDRITDQIGDLDLRSLDLSAELISQYKVIKKMLLDSANDDSIPLNQRAAIANSCTSLLGQIVKLQDEVWNADRLKKMEGAVFAAFKELDTEQRLELGKKFLDVYTRMIG